MSLTVTEAVVIEAGGAVAKGVGRRDCRFNKQTMFHVKHLTPTD